MSIKMAYFEKIMIESIMKNISQMSVKNIKKAENVEKTERYEEGFFAFLP